MRWPVEEMIVLMAKAAAEKVTDTASTWRDCITLLLQLESSTTASRVEALEMLAELERRGLIRHDSPQPDGGR